MSRSMTSVQALSRSLVWDNHIVPTLRPDDSRLLGQLKRYRNAGFRVVGLNAGWDAVGPLHCLKMLAQFRHWIRGASQDYVLLEKAGDLRQLNHRLGVFFDIEGGAALDGQLSMVELYRDLGVRWMLIAYNRNNALGGGCQDIDRGLTQFGRRVVAEMARVGMTVCCSHTGYRTTMDVLRQAEVPVIFSHSNPLGVWRHKRNIRDEAIRACAQTGGVIGINGIGIFLGANDTRSDTIANHIDYVVQLTGIDHVGLGLDYTFDTREIDAFVKTHPDMYPPEEGYAAGVRTVAPEQIREIAATLLARGYTLANLRKVLGGNFARVARATWPGIRSSKA